MYRVLTAEKLGQNGPAVTARVSCLALLVLGGCAGPKVALPAGTNTYTALPAQSAVSPPRDYVVGPLDKLSITVFGERDLSTDQAQVDASGSLLLPLIGKVEVTGKTADALSLELQRRFAKYIVNPRVSIVVLTTVSQRVTIEGSVNQAGVYPVQGRTTLLELLAMAKGPSSVADPHQVAVFRTINHQQMGALFDSSAIATGTAPDPEILGGDIVIVGHSGKRQALQNVLGIAPALGFFVAVANTAR